MVSNYSDFYSFKYKIKIHNFQAVIINPTLLFNLNSEWKKFTEIIRIALIYQYIPQNIRLLFDHFFNIEQPISELVKIKIIVKT